MSVTEFIQKFHYLKGITIGERTKEFNIYLQNCRNSNETDEIIENLKATTFLEEKLRVNVLIHFKRFRELLAIFIGGSEILIKKLWKQTWFFQQLLREYTPEVIVNQLFKDLSYVTRIRFLKYLTKYTHDESIFTSLFDSTIEIYGWHNARFLLIGCKLEKILQVLNERKLTLQRHEVVFLFKHKKQYFTQILNLNNSHEIFDFYDTNSKELQSILGSDFDLFFDIFVKSPNLNLGKRLTSKLISRKSFIFSNMSSYKQFHQRTLLKNMRSDFSKFLFETWPKSFKNFDVKSCMRMLKYYPKSKRFQLIQEGLSKIYNTSIFDHPELIIEDILDSIEDIEMRETLLEIKIKANKDDCTLLKYYRIEKSIPAIKNRINSADNVFVRGNLLESLVDSCKINNDLNALSSVINYFNSRHRNDIKSIREAFLSVIKRTFNLTVLSEEHWKSILDLLKFSEIKNEKPYSCNEFYTEYIKFLYKSKSNREEEINEVVERLFGSESRIQPSSFEEIPELEKFFLMKSILEFKNQDSALELLKAILDWNERYLDPDDSIDFCKYQPIKDAIINEFEKSSNGIDNLMTNFLCEKVKCNELFYNEIETIFWENLQETYEMNIIIYYLRTKPLIIFQNFDKFIEVASRKFDTLVIWNLMRHYDHIGLTEKLITYLKTNRKDGFWISDGVAFATLMNPVEFDSLLKVPDTEQISPNNEEESEEFRRTTNLLRLSKYSSNPSYIIPKIVDCCKGDYKEASLTSLYYSFYHSPEKLLYNPIKILSTRAVSVRKHSVKLACSVLSREVVHKTIRQMIENEKNQSVIEHLTCKTLKFFLVDQTEEFSKLVQDQIKLLNVSTSEVFKTMCKLTKLPEKFQMDFLNLIWNKLESCEEEGFQVDDLKGILINSLSAEVMRKLPYEFCTNLIRNKFLKSENSSYVNEFVSNCLIYSPEKNKILVDVFKILNNFKQCNLSENQNFNDQVKARAVVEAFVEHIFLDFSNNEFVDREIIIRSFFSNWSIHFSPKDDIKSFIKLFLLNELINAENFDGYCLKVASSFKYLVEKFGIVGILDCFMLTLTHISPMKVFQNEDIDDKKYELAFKLIAIDNSSDLKLLALHLLPRKIPESDYLRNIFFSIIKKLKDCDHDCVLINLDLFLSSLTD